MEKQTLSDKIHRNAYEDTPDLDDLIDVNDVKDFIKEIKLYSKILDIKGKEHFLISEEDLHKLAGDKLL
jgi:hypothetical protein